MSQNNENLNSRSKADAYKNRVIFNSDKQESPKPDADVQNETKTKNKDDVEIDLSAKIQFEDTSEFVPMSTQQINDSDELNVEDKMVNIIRPSAKKRWGMTSLVIGFIGLVGWQSVDNLVQAYNTSDWLTLGWTGFIAILASFGISATIKELWKLRRLRNQLTSQELAIDLIHSHQTGKAKPFCENLATQASITLEHAGYDRWIKTVNDNHNDADVIELYDDMVIALQDKQAKKIVATYSTEAAVLVAVSPLALADMCLVAWRSFKMIDELGKIYGVELGYWSRIRLIKLVFINIAAAGASELAVDVSMDMMSMNLAEKVSTRAGQGIGVGLLTGRLGIKAMTLLRPLPWRKDKAVKLSEIRKLVVARVLGKSE